MKTITIPANELQVGDIYHIKSDMSARITSLEMVGKSVAVELTYVTNAYSPGMVGYGTQHSFRLTTKVKITRDQL